MTQFEPAQAADPGAPPAAIDEVDPELLALPAPPRARRFVAIGLMALVAVAAMALIASIRADIQYFFATPRAVDLGDVSAVRPVDLVPNTFVRISGSPMASHTVRFQRMLSSTTYSIFPLAGQRNVFVQVTTDDPDAARRRARTEFTGRLVTFGQLGGRYSEIRSYLHGALGLPVTAESFVVLADEPPGSYGWALAIALLCLLFVAIDVLVMVRWFKPLKVPAAAAPARARE